MATTPHRIDAFTVSPTQKKETFGNKNHVVCRKGDLSRYVWPYIQSVRLDVPHPKTRAAGGVMKSSYVRMSKRI